MRSLAFAVFLSAFLIAAANTRDDLDDVQLIQHRVKVGSFQAEQLEEEDDEGIQAEQLEDEEDDDEETQAEQFGEEDAEGVHAPKLGEPLCSEAMVKEACDTVKCDSEGVVPSSWVSKEAPHLNASVLTKFEEVVGGNWEANKLCKTLLDFIMCSGMPVPPYSDTACYIMDGKAACDVDVSPATLQSITEQDVEIKHVHNLGGGAIALYISANASKSRQKRRLKFRRTFAKAFGHVKTNGTIPHCTDMEVYKVVKHVANVFRIFPAGLPIVTKGHAELTEVETEIEAGAHRTDVFGRRRRRRNCCSTRRRRGKEYSARRRNCQWDLAAKHRRRERNCQSQSSDLWATRLSQADAWLSSALSKFENGQTASKRTKWFGTEGTRDNVQSIYESVENVFDSGVEIVWPADDLGVCKETSAGYGTLAYVYAQHSNFKFYICQILTGQDSTKQIATMLHEAAHHWPGRLRDREVESNGQTYGPYKEDEKLWLAINSPENAVSNAGNFESYIVDVNR